MKKFLLLLLLAFSPIFISSIDVLAQSKVEAIKWDKPSFPSLTDKNWKETKSGLKIWEVKEGKGNLVVDKTKTIKVRYISWLLNEKEIESTLDYEGSIEFPLNKAISGFVEGLTGMKKGSIRRLIVPSDLAYGHSGVTNRIPGDATLVFDIELLDIK